MLCKHEVVGSIPSGSTRCRDHRPRSSLNDSFAEIFFSKGSGGLLNIVKRKRIRSRPVRKDLEEGDCHSECRLTAAFPGAFEARNGLFDRRPAVSRETAAIRASAEGLGSGGRR